MLERVKIRLFFCPKTQLKLKKSGFILNQNSGLGLQSRKMISSITSSMVAKQNLFSFIKSWLAYTGTSF